MSNERGNLSINSENIFPIIKKWLYSDHDIFVRELVSNGCDAITKLKKLDMIGEVSLPEDNKFEIKVFVNPEEKTIKIIDNGIGMTIDEVKEYINQIAFSGAEDFLAKYKDKASDDQIIGHFGLGFYSAFMVAHRVTIDTLSWQEGAKAVHWESEEGVEFEMTESDRTERGTEITLYLNEDSYEFSNEYRMKEVIEKYCSFMPIPIFMKNENAPEEPADSKSEKSEDSDSEDTKPEGPKPLNDTNPLWVKHPNECKDEDYKDFYRKVFHDYKEPLFWIHLNMDYPFNLKGILYFPKLNLEYDSLDGVIKLYSNQVFIADNIKEVIPEFLMLLKGVIDCPDLPLNVSRSALQNDGFVTKISDYITKKVADKLSGMFKVDRENYEKFWDDICPFIKFGCLKDQKFREKMKDFIIFKDLDGKYITLPDYVQEAKAKAEEEEKKSEKKSKKKKADNGEELPVAEGEIVDEDADKASDADESEAKTTDAESSDEDIPEEKKSVVYYVTDEKQQIQYINMFKKEGINAVILTHNIDQPFITQLEQDNKEVRFQRIDADITDSFKENVNKKESSALKKEAKALEELFRKLLNKEKLEVKVEKLKSDKVSAMITLSEENRRMQDMMKMYGSFGMDNDMFGEQQTLILNANHPLVEYVYAHKEDDSCKILCEQLYDLAMLGHKPLAPEAMTRFVERSNEIMLLLANK